jgi:hypothetical protein
MCRPPFTPPGRFLVLISVRGWVDPRATIVPKSNDVIGIRTHDLAACSIVLQPTTLLCAPFSFGNLEIIWCTLQRWILQNCYSILKMAVPQIRTLVAFFVLSINPCIVGPELVWQCKVSIWRIYCNSNNSCYALSVECKTTFAQLLHSFHEQNFLLLIMFAQQMFNPRCIALWH